MKKRLMAVLLCLIMALTLLPAPAFAAGEPDVWDGTADTSWYSTVSTTMYISDAEDLAGFSQLVNGGNTFRDRTVKLSCDLNLANREWTPISSRANTEFLGVLDGQSHTISGLRVSSGELCGLFGSIDSVDTASGGVRQSVVKNLHVSGSVSGDRAGGIVGFAMGKVINCTFTGDVYGTVGAGGIAGVSRGAEFAFCASYADVTGSDGCDCGKFAGLVDDGKIISCYNVFFNMLNIAPKAASNVSAYNAATMSKAAAAAKLNTVPESYLDRYGEYYWVGQGELLSITLSQEEATRCFTLDMGYDSITEQIYGDMSLVLPAPEREGHTFYMWRHSGGAYYNAGSTLPAGNHTLTALWLSDTITHTVTVGAPENGTVTLYFPDEPEVVYAEGTVIENVKDGKPAILKYLADGGYCFEYMTVNGVGAEGLCTIVNGDITVSASFIESVQTENTEATVTIPATGSVTYFDSFAEAVGAVNENPGLTSGTVGQAVITLLKDATVFGGTYGSKNSDMPSKPCTINGSDKKYTILSNSGSAVYLNSTIKLQDIALDPGMRIYTYKATSVYGQYSLALENASVGILVGVQVYTIRLCGLTLVGNVSIFDADFFSKIEFDNATVSVSQSLESDSYILNGQSSCVFTGTSAVGRLRSDNKTLSTAFTASDGTLSLGGGGSWTPSVGHSVLIFKAPAATETFPEQLICSFGNNLTLRKEVKSGIEYYKLAVVPVYSISAAPETLSFGSVYTGYTQPAAQTVTVTNTGNQSVTVGLPTLESYTVTAGTGFTDGSATLAANGDTATFTVQPNASLGANTYNGTLSVTGSNGVSAAVDVSFAVTPPPPTVTAVSVTPAAASVLNGGSETFTATVTGTNDPAQTVTWSVTGNSSAATAISAAGVLTVAADETAAELTVKATSAVDTGKFGTSAVAVTIAPVTIGGKGMTAAKSSYYVNGADGAPGTVSDTAPEGGWNAYYNGSTLYLNGLNLIDYNSVSGIAISGCDITLDLASTNTVSVSENSDVDMDRCSALLFTSAKGKTNTLTVKSTAGGGSMYITAHNPSGFANGISVNGDMLMESGLVESRAAGKSGEYWEYAIDIVGGVLTVNGGTLTGKPVDGKTCDTGINCSDSISITDGVVNGIGTNKGVCAFSAISISGGEVTATGSGIAGLLIIAGKLHISGGTVNGSGYYGALADTDNRAQIEITGGDVTLAGTASALSGSFDLSGYPAPGYVAKYGADVTGGTTTETISYTYDAGHKYLRVAPISVSLKGALGSEGATVSYEVDFINYCGTATLLLAQYEAGRMIDVRSKAVAESTDGEYSFAVVSGKEYTFKLFLLDGNYAPLGDAVLAQQIP